MRSGMRPFLAVLVCLLASSVANAASQHALGPAGTGSVGIAVSAHPLACAPMTAQIAAAPANGSAPLTVHFSLTISGGCTPYRASWQFGDEAEAFGLSVNHTFYGAGLYSVLAEVSDANGSEVRANTTVAVVGGGGPFTVAVAAAPVTGVAPLAVTLWANVSGANVSDDQRVNWSFGDGGDGTGSPVRHIYSAPGTYSAVARTSDDSGEDGSGSVAIVVQSSSGSSPANLTIRATPTTGTAPLNVTVRAASDGGASGSRLEICFGDQSPCAYPVDSWSGQGTVEVNHTYVSAGNYTIVGTLLSANQSVLVGATASVAVAPAAPLVVEAAATPTTGPTPFLVEFTATVAGGTAPYTLQWDFGDGTSGSTVAGGTAEHTYDAAGTFVPRLTVSDAAGHQWSGALPAVLVRGPTSLGWSSQVGGVPAIDLVALGLAGGVASGFVLGRASIRSRRVQEMRLVGEALVREMEHEK